ncbi:aminodeoxychorismate lyase [Algoriphagus jejuensis]|uniref:branched-chain-amino-acid transaminase n=1 Tax=Algoriphagus jejuensis TaxID=419934 RepID=A0ABP3YHF8_9BACT
MSGTDTVYTFESRTGIWVPASELPIPNRAMNFGDGLFETMVFDGDRIRFFDFHLDRLQLGMDTLKIGGFSTDFAKLNHWLKDEFSGKPLRIRWNVFRSGSGTYTPQTNESVQTLHIQDFVASPLVKAQAAFAEGVQLYPTAWSACKTLNALPYILAAQERVERNLDELILQNYLGKVAEASSANIFWRRGKKVFTPGLACGCIGGVGRRAILEKIPRLVTQGIFGTNELLSAEQVWVSNASGISYLEKIDSLEFSTEPWEPLLEIFE